MSKSKSLSVFAAAEDAFVVLVQRPAPLVFDARDLPIAGGTGGMLPLDELRDLLVRQVISGPVVDRVWYRLVVQAREWGPEWVLGAVGVALPGLRRLAGRLSAGRPHLVEDIESEVVAGFLAALRGPSGVGLDAPRLWLRLLWSAWRAGHAATQVREHAELPDDLPAGSSTPHIGYGHPDLLLGRAAAAGVISPEDAELIGATRLGGVLVESLAPEYGVSAAALRMRRVRAERRLLRAIRDGALTDVLLGVAARRDPAVQARRDGFTGPSTKTATGAATRTPARSARLGPSTQVRMSGSRREHVGKRRAV